MDAKTCIKKLRLICATSMATVDENGNPQVRIIDIMHVDDEKVYFLTARGKPFYQQLLRTKIVAMASLSRFNEMIRLTGIPEPLPKEEQSKWLDIIFEENPPMQNVYPGNTRGILEVFCIQNGEIEYFNLGVHPIFRETYLIGKGVSHTKKYFITDKCTGCGSCLAHCPQQCINNGAPFSIIQENCLQCGACKENCPSGAIELK